MSDVSQTASKGRAINPILVWVPLLLIAAFAALSAFMLKQPKDKYVES